MGDHKLKMRMQIKTLQKNTNMLETRLFFINLRAGDPTALARGGMPAPIFQGYLVFPL